MITNVWLFIIAYANTLKTRSLRAISGWIMLYAFLLNLNAQNWWTIWSFLKCFFSLSFFIIRQVPATSSTFKMCWCAWKKIDCRLMKNVKKNNKSSSKMRRHFFLQFVVDFSHSSKKLTLTWFLIIFQLRSLILSSSIYCKAQNCSTLWNESPITSV